MQPRRQDYALLLLLGAVWGASFLLIKLAVATVPPLSIAAGRILIGAAVMLPVLRWRGLGLPASRQTWAKLLFMGGIGTVVPFALINWGETQIDSGLAAILMSAVPFSTLLLAHLFQRDEPLTPGKLVGVALGTVGLVVLIGPSALAGAGQHVAAELAVLVATLCYAANSIVARRLGAVAPEVMVAGMLLAAGLFGVPLCLVVDRPWQSEPSALSLLALVVLGVLPTAFGYLLSFRIIVRAGAGFASFNNFLVPVFGVLWGVLLLGETPRPSALAGLAIVLAGLAAPRLWPRRLRAADAPE
ncbi:MAG: DMT family transporter [Rhodospirillaceae bacterium]|nr:DMT family transporter [Rhodospirillaceae bacterium]